MHASWPAEVGAREGRFRTVGLRAAASHTKPLPPAPARGRGSSARGGKSTYSKSDGGRAGRARWARPEPRAAAGGRGDAAAEGGGPDHPEGAADPRHARECERSDAGALQGPPHEPARLGLRAQGGTVDVHRLHARAEVQARAGSAARAAVCQARAGGEGVPAPRQGEGDRGPRLPPPPARERSGGQGAWPCGPRDAWSRRCAPGRRGRGRRPADSPGRGRGPPSRVRLRCGRGDPAAAGPGGGREAAAGGVRGPLAGVRDRAGGSEEDRGASQGQGSAGGVAPRQFGGWGAGVGLGALPEGGAQGPPPVEQAPAVDGAPRSSGRGRGDGRRRAVAAAAAQAGAGAARSCGPGGPSQPGDAAAAEGRGDADAGDAAHAAVEQGGGEALPVHHQRVWVKLGAGGGRAVEQQRAAGAAPPGRRVQEQVPHDDQRGQPGASGGARVSGGHHGLEGREQEHGTRCSGGVAPGARLDPEAAPELDAGDREEAHVAESRAAAFQGGAVPAVAGHPARVAPPSQADGRQQRRGGNKVLAAGSPRLASRSEDGAGVRRRRGWAGAARRTPGRRRGCSGRRTACTAGGGGAPGVGAGGERRLPCLAAARGPAAAGGGAAGRLAAPSGLRGDAPAHPPRTAGRPAAAGEPGGAAAARAVLDAAERASRDHAAPVPPAAPGAAPRAGRGRVPAHAAGAPGRARAAPARIKGLRPLNEQVGLGIHDPMTHCKPGRGKRPRARLVSLEARAGDQTSKQWRQSPARRSPAACNPFRLPRIADPHAQRPQCLRAVVVVFKVAR